MRMPVSLLAGAALTLALLTGVLVALYTVVDAYAIRIARDPFTFIFWFFFLEAFLFPPLMWRRWRASIAFACSACSCSSRCSRSTSRRCRARRRC